jgi:hypothetical protein
MASPLAITHSRSQLPPLADGLRAVGQVNTQRVTEKLKTWCMRLKQYLLTAQSFALVALLPVQWAQTSPNFFLEVKELLQ